MIYSAFGLTFQSTLKLPDFRVEPASTKGTDVVIDFGPAPRPAGLAEIVPAVLAGTDEFWMEVPGVGRILVVAGARITGDLDPGVDAAQLTPFILSTAMGALLHQRGVTPFHACTAVIGDTVVAFVGESGAGKSTLALHLSRRGHRVLGDDLCATRLRGDVPWVWPGPASLKLRRDALERVGLSSAGRDRVAASADKVFHRPAQLASDHPVRLDMVAQLAVRDGPAQLVSLTSSDGVALLVANTFRGQLVPALGLSGAHWQRCVAIARGVTFTRLERAWSTSGIAGSVAAIEDHCKFRYRR